MDLKVIDDKGQPAAPVAGSDALFGRDYNEPLIHQLVTAYQANARSGTRKQKGRGDVNKSHKKPWAQKGTGRARAGQANSPLWRGGGKIFPSLPDENFEQKVNRKMYRAGIASILSQLHREGRLSVIDALAVEAPKTKLFAQKVKALGLPGTLLIVVDKFDDNVFLSSRNLRERAGAGDAGDRPGEPRALQPRAAHQGRGLAIRGDAGMSTVKYNPERLAVVLLAPVVSEKATFIADKHEQVIFKVAPDATKPEVKAAVEAMFKVEVKSVQIANVGGKMKRFGRFTGRRRSWKKAYVCLKAGQEINFAAEGPAHRRSPEGARSPSRT